MRELELREKKVNEIQATGERLLKEGHPGRKTVEVGDGATPLVVQAEKDWLSSHGSNDEKPWFESLT